MNVVPEQATYHYGDVVTLTAEEFDLPFIGWNGDASGSDNPLTIEVQGDTQITANYGLIYYLPIMLQ